MSKYADTFIPETFYHVFDRANGDDELFRNDENYSFFLKKVKHYFAPYFDIWAYCLLPNHFHFVLRTKSIEDITANLKELKSNTNVTLENFHEQCLKSCSSLLNSYAKSYNKYYNRKDALFIEHFKRIELKQTSDVISAIFYVHKNPIHHGLVPVLDDWRMGSYRKIKYQHKDDMVDYQRVLDFFGGMDAFDKVHAQYKYK